MWDHNRVKFLQVELDSVEEDMEQSCKKRVFKVYKSQSIRHRLQKLYVLVNVSNFLQKSTFVK